MQIRFEVLGTPAPKGSTHATMVNGRAVNLPAGSSKNRANLRNWDVQLRDAARAAVGDRAEPPFVDKALNVKLVFRLQRPGGHWAKRGGGIKPSAPLYPRSKPDADKLARATLDSLTGIVFDDDARIVVLVVEKYYASPGNEGATITVDEEQ